MLAAYSHLTIAAAPAGELMQARFPLGVNPAKRCPELRHTSAEEGAVAVVQFLVGPTGVPSQISMRQSSGSESFDAAVMGCVPKLRFQPATRLGDATAVESWQQLALKSTGPAAAPQTARCDQSATASSGDTLNSVVATNPQEVDDPKHPGPMSARAGVCVCVDENGKLTQQPVLTNSSGVAGFDKAALELSAAAHYRPAASSSGQPAPGCFRFKVGLDVK
jgi:TonB family protein